MANVEGRTAQYGLFLIQLQALMELRGREAVEELDQLGGVKGVCKKLCTSSTQGMHFSLSPCAASSVVTCCNFAGLSGSTKDIEHRQQTFGSNTIPSKPPLWRFVKEALQIVVVIILGVAGICYFLSLLNSKAAGKDRSLFSYLKCRSETSLSMRYLRRQGQDSLLIHWIFLDGIDKEDKSHEWIEGLAILISVIVVVNAFTDYTKERHFRSLQSWIEGNHKFVVLRGGESYQIPVSEIVVGDICQVRAEMAIYRSLPAVIGRFYGSASQLMMITIICR